MKPNAVLAMTLCLAGFAAVPTLAQTATRSKPAVGPAPAVQSAAIPAAVPPAAGFSASPRDYAAFDAAVRALPPAASIAAAVAGIARIAKDDGERARGAYVWIAEHIAYDVDSFFNRTAPTVDAEGVFRTGKSVCAGYSMLFKRFAQDLGLEVVTVSGRAKGYGYQAGAREIPVNHDWNAVRFDGAWRLMDSTWGAGWVGGDRRFMREFSGFWFDCPPELFVAWHLPEDAAWQLVDPPVSYAAYLKRAYFESGDFERLFDAGMPASALVEWYRAGRLPDAYAVAELAGFGVPAAALVGWCRADRLPDAYYFGALAGYGFPMADLVAAVDSGGIALGYVFDGVSMRIAGAPAGRVLAAGQPFAIALTTADVTEAAIVNNGKWTYLKARDGVLAGTMNPAAGELSVNLHIVNDGVLSWWRVLEYVVR